jgi:hypothetical protein
MLGHDGEACCRTGRAVRVRERTASCGMCLLRYGVRCIDGCEASGLLLFVVRRMRPAVAGSLVAAPRMMLKWVFFSAFLHVE